MPTAITKDYYRKRFQIDLKYRDDQGKIRSKRVLFGYKGRTEYIDGGNESVKLRRLGSQSGADDMFSSRFWTNVLLNRKPTLMEAFTLFCSELGLMTS